MKSLYARLGPISRNEILAVLIVLRRFGFESSLVHPGPRTVGQKRDHPGIDGTVLRVPSRIVGRSREDVVEHRLLFGGAMSIGFCLWQTGAAEWLAIKWLGLLHGTHWIFFVLGVATFVY